MSEHEDAVTAGPEQVTEYGRKPSGYRLPAATRLGRVRLQVADLDRSLAYYREVIGFRVLERSGGRALLGVQGGGVQPGPQDGGDQPGPHASDAPPPGPHASDAALLELVERPGAKPAPPHGRLGLYHFAILLPDRAALGRFALHLAELGVRAGASDHLVSEAFYLQDPDGLGIEVYADRPRSSWPTSGGQLQMDTLHLDLRSLVNAAGNSGWEGLPEGTVIGHLHLHVGDLERAADFYHEGLGLDAVVWGYPGALFLSAGGYHHHLGLNTWAAGARPAGAEDARLLEWEVVLPTAEDAAAAAESLRAAGYDPSREGDAWLAVDPWGTTLRLRAA